MLAKVLGLCLGLRFRVRVSDRVRLTVQSRVFYVYATIRFRVKFGKFMSMVRVRFGSNFWVRVSFSLGRGLGLVLGLGVSVSVRC